MSHLNYEKWVAYVNDEVDEADRQTYEEHVFTCDKCLDLYMQAVESQVDRLPELADDFTEQVVQHVFPVQSERKAKSIFKRSFFHYVIAAAMTLILMSSGLFGQLTQVASNFEEQANQEQSQSFTEELIDKTLSFIQVIDRNKEAK